MSTYFCFGYLPSSRENYLFNPNFAHYVTASRVRLQDPTYLKIFFTTSYPGITGGGGGGCVVHDGVVGMNKFGNFQVFEVGGLTIGILHRVCFRVFPSTQSTCPKFQSVSRGTIAKHKLMHQALQKKCSCDITYFHKARHHFFSLSL